MDFPQRKKLIALTQPARNGRAKCSTTLKIWRSISEYQQSSCIFRMRTRPRAIIETAKSRGCDLIVMGSHGHRGLGKLFLGSRTSEVLADERAGVGGPRLTRRWNPGSGVNIARLPEPLGKALTLKRRIAHVPDAKTARTPNSSRRFAFQCKALVLKVLSKV